MLLVICPHCGARPEIEFHCGGEAHLARPAQPAASSDQEWTEFLYYRTNPKGIHAERWVHRHGCGRWFVLSRDTVSDAFVSSAGERP